MVEHADRNARREPLKEIQASLLADYERRNDETAADDATVDLKYVERAYDQVMKKVVRGRIINDGVPA